MADYNAKRTMKALPIGSVMPWTGNLTQIPKGWLLCNGAEVPAADYPLLARVIRDTYGGSGFDGDFPNYLGTIRLPPVNQKCLADISITHFSSNANLRPAPIDNPAAAAVIGQYLGDEGDLGPPNTFFALTDLNFSYTPDPSGFISSFNAEGVAAVTLTPTVYRNVAATGGAGSGALFTVVKNNDQTYAVSITQKGSGYDQGDLLTIPFSSVGGDNNGNDITITVNAVGNSFFKGTISGQTFIGGFDIRSVYVVPRKLGRDHMPQHFHQGTYETTNKGDAGEFPGTGVGVWDNPQINIAQTYRQENGCPNDFCFSAQCQPNGPLESTGIANYWADQTGLTSNTATVGAPNSPFDLGYGRYALAAIGGSKPARTHSPIQTTAVAHGVGKPWFTSAQKLRTRTSGETETAALTNLRTTGRIDVNTTLPFSDDLQLIKQPNYDPGTGGSDQPINPQEVLFNSAANSFTTTVKTDTSVNNVIETHNHEGEFNIIYNPGNLNIRDFISVDVQPNVIPDNLPGALQIAFTLSSPSLAVTNLIRAY